MLGDAVILYNAFRCRLYTSWLGHSQRHTISSILSSNIRLIKYYTLQCCPFVKKIIGSMLILPSALFCPVCAEACAGKFAGGSKFWGVKKIGRIVKSN